jgi:hypothetical protein
MISLYLYQLYSTRMGPQIWVHLDYGCSHSRLGNRWGCGESLRGKTIIHRHGNEVETPLCDRFQPCLRACMLLRCLQMEQWRCIDGTAKALGVANKLSPHPQSSGAEVSPAPNSLWLQRSPFAEYFASLTEPLFPPHRRNPF